MQPWLLAVMKLLFESGGMPDTEHTPVSDARSHRLGIDGISSIHTDDNLDYFEEYAIPVEG